MAEILRLKNLVAKLQARAAASLKEDNVSVVVGYTAAYALYVHENIEMKWRGLPRGGGLTRDKEGVVVFSEKLLTQGSGATGKGFYWDPPGRGQSKFLEQPARELNNDGTFSNIALGVLRKGKTMAQALLLCGLRLQRESQKLVPVDTANLKASAFTRLDKGQG